MCIRTSRALANLHICSDLAEPSLLENAIGTKIAYVGLSILLKEPFALKNSETVYFTSIFSTPSYSDIAPIDNFDLTFFYFYFVFEVFDTIQF